MPQRILSPVTFSLHFILYNGLYYIWNMALLESTKQSCYYCPCEWTCLPRIYVPPKHAPDSECKIPPHILLNECSEMVGLGTGITHMFVSRVMCFDVSSRVQLPMTVDSDLWPWLTHGNEVNTEPSQNIMFLDSLILWSSKCIYVRFLPFTTSRIRRLLLNFNCYSLDHYMSFFRCVLEM